MTSIRGTGPVPKKTRKSKKMKTREVENSIKADDKEKTLWKWFSLYVRLKGCPEDSKGFGRCISCGKIDHYKAMDAGHYVRSRHKAVRYDETNVHLQCVHCNRNLNGNEAAHRIAMVEMYGEDHVKWVESQKGKIVKFQLYEVEAMTAEFRQKAKDEAFRVGVDVR